MGLPCCREIRLEDGIRRRGSMNVSGTAPASVRLGVDSPPVELVVDPDTWLLGRWHVTRR